MNDQTTLESPRFKPMDVVFLDVLWKPRCLIIEVDPKYPLSLYTYCSQSGGVGSRSEHAMRTQEEWLTWIDRFADELTGRELREAKEAVQAPFTEPDFWTAFRKRFAESGDPWLKQ